MIRIKITLWVLAVSFLIGFIFMLFPWQIINRIYIIAGEQPISQTAAVEYSIRVTCGIVGVIGIYFLILAIDPLKYKTLVFFSSYALIGISLMCIITGLLVDISAIIILGDSLFGFILGIILLLISLNAFRAKALP